MLALIDGDILLYRIGFSTENESESVAKVRMSEYISEILQGSGAGEYRIFLSPSDKTNFRYDLLPSYKGNRTQPKPKWFWQLKQYLIEYEEAIVAIEQEADDLLGIMQMECMANSVDSIICSIDKDLLQIPGFHYNFVKQRIYKITPELGRYNFYMQLLTGDTTDNIPGIDGIGPKKAQRILEGCRTIREYNKAVLEAYKDHFIYCNEDELIKHIEIIGNLLYIRKKYDEKWKFKQYA